MRIGCLIGMMLQIGVLFAQSPVDNWFFGNGAGIRFSNNDLTSIDSFSEMFSEAGSSAISDKNGDLLFFTNGETIWNKDHEIMDNGSGLNGSHYATQSSLITPWPGNPFLYYVFTVDECKSINSHGLCYSIVDLAENEGKGKVISKNNHLLSEVSEKLTGTFHQNESDIWVVVHGIGSNSFYAFLLTEKGLSTIPVQSNIGSVYPEPVENELVGNMKFSPNGNQLASAIHSLNVFELFSFDKSTGEFFSVRATDPVFRGAYYVEFSPDSKKFYGSTNAVNSGHGNSYIFQFDLTAPDLQTSVASIPTPADMPVMASALLLGPDGKIYVSRYNDDSLGVISNPNRSGVLCDFDEKATGLGGRKAKSGLPNFMTGLAKIKPFLYIGSCTGDTVFFFLQNKANIDSVSWDFNDSDPDAEGNSTGTLAWHIYNEPGMYSVKMISYYKGEFFKDASEVIIHPRPEPELGELVMIYPGSSVLLKTQKPYEAYLWQDNSTLDELQAYQEGDYKVTVTDTNGCENSDTIAVRYFEFSIPNAFTPNGDGLNDKFCPILPDAGFSNYEIMIFNRWGRRVFYSNDHFDGWDGTNSDQGTYVWVIRFEANLYDVANTLIEKKGTVVLLR